MKKTRGTCIRCGETTVGIKGNSWGGREHHGYLIGRREKKGNIKCLTCQRTDGVNAK